MKKFKLIPLILLFMFTLASCRSEKERVSDFSDAQLATLKEQSVVYSVTDYSEGLVPLKSYVKLSGKIIKTDAKVETTIEKNDRFILLVDDVKFHIINASETPLAIDDIITLYGEYNGITVASLIEH